MKPSTMILIGAGALAAYFVIRKVTTPTVVTSRSTPTSPTATTGRGGWDVLAELGVAALGAFTSVGNEGNGGAQIDDPSFDFAV